MKILTLDEIAAKNPHLHPGRLEEVDKLLERLRKLGVRPDEYSLRHPFAPVRTQEEYREMSENKKAMRHHR